MDQVREAIRRKATKQRQAAGLPWFREFDGYWYVTIRGERHKLVKGNPDDPANNRPAALAEWHRLMALTDVKDKNDSNFVWVIFEKYLDHIHKHHSGSYQSHKCYCQSFKDRFPDLRICDLTVEHVEKWLEDHPNWTESTINFVTSVILASLNFAANPKRRYIQANPLRGMSRPPIRSRGAESVITEETYQIIYNAATPAMKESLFFLRQTGTRPCNLARITAAAIDAGNRCVRIGQHKTRGKTGRPLPIPLTKTALRQLEQLARKYPEGPLFRDSHGKPMTGERLNDKFQYLKKKLGLKGKAILYGLRHTLATELLIRDVPDAKVAFILGHKGTAMLYHHYGHLDTASRSIAEELDRAINGDAGGSASPASPPADAGGDGEALPHGPEQAEAKERG